MTLTYVLRGPKTLIVRNKLLTAVNSKPGLGTDKDIIDERLRGLVDDTSLSSSVVRVGMYIGDEGSAFRKQPRWVCDTFMADKASVVNQVVDTRPTYSPQL